MTTIFAGFYCDYSWHTKGYWFSSKKEIVLLPKKKKARSQVHLKQVDTVATKAIINLSACHILNLIINTRLLGPPIFPISQISVMLSHFVLRQRLDSVLLIFSIFNTDNSNRSVNNPYFHLFLSSTVSHFCFHSTIVCISLLITLALFYINITVYTFPWHPIYQLFYCLRIFTRSTSTDQNQVWESSNGSMLKSIKCVLLKIPESYDLLRHCIEPLKQCMYFQSSQTTTRRNKQRIMRIFMLTLKISEGGAWINA